MQILELKLKKDVLIVDAENGFYIFKIYDDEIGFISIENGIPRKELVKGSYKFLCKGSELTEEIASELVEKHCMCFVCGGDGKETCTNPDHGFISMLSFHDVGRLGCPCCGHDPNHKIKNGGNCECCNGLGKLTETQFNQQAYEYGFDDDIDFNLSKESFISAVESKEKFWLENPIYKILVFLGNKSEIDKQIALQKQEIRWQEAEAKTFKNPLIFVKN